VSACLVGWNCRYDGGSKLSKEILALASKEGWSLAPACPEVLGGLGIPREPATIIGGDGKAVIEGKARVMDKSGRDVTRQFVTGAKKTLEIAQRTCCVKAIFKENSPSCGVNFITDAEGRAIKGMGVAAALFYSRNIPVEGRS